MSILLIEICAGRGWSNLRTLREYNEQVGEEENRDINIELYSGIRRGTQRDWERALIKVDRGVIQIDEGSARTRDRVSFKVSEHAQE